MARQECVACWLCSPRSVSSGCPGGPLQPVSVSGVVGVPWTRWGALDGVAGGVSELL